MRKSLWIFLLAVLIPSAVLGWLALRSAEEQKIILERRTLELYQHETEGLATAARSVIDEQRRSFNDAVRRMLAQSNPEELSKKFSAELPRTWPIKAVGFTIGQDGRLLSPSPRAAVSNPDWQKFLWEQGSFLGGDIAATVYTVPVEALAQSNWAGNKRGTAEYNTFADGKTRSLNLNRPVQSQAAQVQEPVRDGSAEKTEVFAIKKAAPSQSPNSKDVLEMKLKFNNQKLETPSATAAQQQQTISKPVAPAQGEAATRQQRQRTDALMPEPTAALQGASPSAPPPAPTAQTTPGTPTAPANGQVPSPSGGALMDEAKLDRMNRQGEVASGVRLEEAKQQAEQESQRRTESQSTQLRNVQPLQSYVQTDKVAWSAIAPETTEFRVLCQGLEEGIVTRFVQDKLALIFWLRPAQAPSHLFGCVVDASDLRELWAKIMPEPHLNSRGSPEFVVALLDDRARPVSTAPANETNRDWKRPFVASEIGEALPHWEAALYLMRPEQLQESASGLRRTLTFLIVAMLGAIILGGWLVVADARRQFALAQQKTDFVSNVSHELKTPLTSIRMFAELMLGGRDETKAKSPQYLRIIMVEAERLTRLINNVLDFAKLERRQKRFDKKPLDLHAMIGRIWESHELHLRESGFSTKWQAATPPYPIVGDEDALAQILVNLLSNAEKYSGDRKEIELQTYLDDHHVCIAVLDRGNGVPPGEERKIFEAFYRAHDSLSSGIQGSGLGLTLAQRLAEEHGGTIEYRAREGGGSAFTLKLPLTIRNPQFPGNQQPAASNS
jgi:signal transduction histidine kinase